MKLSLFVDLNKKLNQLKNPTKQSQNLEVFYDVILVKTKFLYLYNFLFLQMHF